MTAPSNGNSYGVSRNLWLSAAMLLGFVAIVALLGIQFESEIRGFTESAAHSLGFGGLAAFLMLSDFFLSPMPPEVILLVIAKSALRELDWVYVPLLGALSSMTGTITWSLGRKLGRTRIPERLFGESLGRSRAFLQRYGSWAVALGAITPIPYSLTCWSAGMFGLEWRRFFWPSLLRIPRVVFYYLAIVYAEEISALFR